MVFSQIFTRCRSSSSKNFYLWKQGKVSDFKKCFEENHVYLLLIGKEGKIHYVLIKNFNTFMYDNTLHCGRKHFCHYCLQAFHTENILKSHVKDCFKMNDKQMIGISKGG